MTSCEAIEVEIQEKGLTAPRVTLDHINTAIAKETYQRIENTTVTVCVLEMKNGFSVIGHSACVSTANFDADLGKKIARQHAVDQCWALFGFHLAAIQTGWSMDS